jgi:ABC-2 type transport system ATP-binding protein
VTLRTDAELTVETNGLTKRYASGVLAVDRLDLRIRRAEIYGFLGLNGAGKSTAIRMLLGMIRPTAGRALVLGQPVRADMGEVWSRVGHLVESATAYPDLTVRENLVVAARLQRIVNRSAIGRVIEQLRLEPYVNRRAGILSLGNLQRLALARALLHDPELLVLDEPANGLDPAGVIEVRELLSNLARQRGTTVLMSSHVLAEVDLLATRIGIIHRGQLVEELDSEALQRHRDPRLEVAARDLDDASDALAVAGYQPRRAQRERLLELREARAREHPEDVARLLVASGNPPTHLAITQETLEDHFMRLTREEAAT